MKLTIMQPTFMPWIGFFKLMSICDMFVYLDDVQIAKRSWQQRNKFFISGNEKHITVPILSKHKYNQKINQTLIDNSQNWKKKHLNSFKHIYGRAEYFNDFFPLIKKIYEKEHLYLAELNIEIIKVITKYLNIEVKGIKSSEIPSRGFKSERLISIIKYLNGKKYISPIGSKNYIELNKFKENQIEFEYFEYVPKKYNQLKNKTFVSHLSIVDYIFNCGKNNFELI